MTTEEEAYQEAYERAVAVLLHTANDVAEKYGVCMLCLIYGAAAMTDQGEKLGLFKHWSEGDHEHDSEAVH